jgi:hypothetical protein
MTTTTKTPTPAPPTLEQLRAQRAEVERRHLRAASLLNHARTPDRDAEDVDLEELVLAPEVVARTRHELRTLDIQILRLERDAAAAAEAARVAGLAEGQQLLMREWPTLVAQTRRVQQQWQALAERLEGIDHRLGGQLRFRSAAWPAMDANGQFDFFVRATADGFRLVLDE